MLYVHFLCSDCSKVVLPQYGDCLTAHAVRSMNSLAKNVYACAATKITWSVSGKVKMKMKEEMAAFFVSGSVVVLLPL